jgi:hypothetical protein
MITVHELESGKICCEEFVNARNYNKIDLIYDPDTKEGVYHIGFYDAIRWCPFCSKSLHKM